MLEPRKYVAGGNITVDGGAASISKETAGPESAELGTVPNTWIEVPEKVNWETVPFGMYVTVRSKFS